MYLECYILCGEWYRPDNIHITSARTLYDYVCVDTKRSRQIRSDIHWILRILICWGCPESKCSVRCSPLLCRQSVAEILRSLICGCCPESECSVRRKTLLCRWSVVGILRSLKCGCCPESECSVRLMLLLCRWSVAGRVWTMQLTCGRSFVCCICILQRWYVHSNGI